MDLRHLVLELLVHRVARLHLQRLLLVVLFYAVVLHEIVQRTAHSHVQQLDREKEELCNGAEFSGLEYLLWLFAIQGIIFKVVEPGVIFEVIGADGEIFVVFAGDYDF